MKTAQPSLAQIKPVSGGGEPVFLQAKQFPARVGRGADCVVRLCDEGVWEHHLELRVDAEMRVTLQASSEATAMVNGEPLEGVRGLGN